MFKNSNYYSLKSPILVLQSPIIYIIYKTIAQTKGVSSFLSAKKWVPYMNRVLTWMSLLSLYLSGACHFILHYSNTLMPTCLLWISKCRAVSLTFPLLFLRCSRTFNLNSMVYDFRVLLLGGIVKILNGQPIKSWMVNQWTYK